MRSTWSDSRWSAILVKDRANLLYSPTTCSLRANTSRLWSLTGRLRLAVDGAHTTAGEATGWRPVSEQNGGGRSPVPARHQRITTAIWCRGFQTRAGDR
ncbi:MAG: hypothetical protein EBT09_01335 [Actinobacteria bacterium]|nr:hypothetical protein [Actinomycetota bacterium]